MRRQRAAVREAEVLLVTAQESEEAIRAQWTSERQAWRANDEQLHARLEHLQARQRLAPRAQFLISCHARARKEIQAERNVYASECRSAAIAREHR